MGRSNEFSAKVNICLADSSCATSAGFDDFSAGRYVDISSSEFWAKNNGRRGEAKLASSTAHTYGRKRVAAEAFTGRIANIFEANPRDSIFFNQVETIRVFYISFQVSNDSGQRRIDVSV